MVICFLAKRGSSCMKKIAVVEDNKSSAEALISLIDEYKDKNNVSLSVVLFESAIPFLYNYKGDFDIVFMDINMPNLNGMEASHKLREIDKEVVLIFVTDMAQFAIEGYSVDAVDFIVKPITYFSLSKVLDKAIKILDNRTVPEILLKQKDSVHRMKATDIIYIEVSRHRLIYHTTQGDVEGWGTLDNLEKTLPPNYFLRCHQSFMVGLNHITGVIGDDVVLSDKTRLKISKIRKKIFLSELAGYLGDKN